MSGITIDFAPDGATLEAYLLSQARIRLIQGPRGSGKSRSSCIALGMEAAQQNVNPKTGRRHSRTYIIRRTFDELKRTTVNTWLSVYPEEQFGTFKWSKPFEHRITAGDLDWEVIFLALDDPSDLEKLKSAEISSAWVNEFSELDRRVLDDLDPCLGRYPSQEEGGCRRPFIIADTNPGDELHWFSIMSGQTPMPDSSTEDERRTWRRPDTWDIFIQPPAMFEVADADGEITYEQNPNAENLRWLPAGYYVNMCQGKSRPWILRNACNRPASTEPGTPVWSQFREEVHVSKEPLVPYQGHPLLIGVDFGRTPAAVIGQRVHDRWLILSELYETNMGARRFAAKLRGHLAERFPGFHYQIWGDPSGDDMAQADDISPFMMFAAEKMPIRAAPSNDPTVRIGAVREVLQDMVDGKPRFILSCACTFLKASMNDGYKFAQRTDNQTEAVAPLKNRFSHIADALQYLMLGAGEGVMLLHGNGARPEPRVAPRPASLYTRTRQRRIGPARTLHDRRAGR